MHEPEIKQIIKKECLVCTWDDEENCLDCELRERLDCRWERSLLIRFYMGGGLAIVSAIIALIITGLFVSWIPALIYIIFWIFFFGFFEIRVLCSHCPYYAKDGIILNCLANHGTIKVWKYHPEPMNLFEKFGFLLGVLFFVFFPFVTELYSIATLQAQNILINKILIILAFTSLLGGIYFFYILQKNICPKCVNFSCPLNRVSKELIDIYLKKNPVMREAWETAGYKID
ncbi:hypothetical protein [Candidatus Hodarchaeum mangrovi]